MEYLFVEWQGEDAEKHKHSVVDCKVAELVKATSFFVPGEKVQCKFKEGVFAATIHTAGMRTIMHLHVRVHAHACVY